MENNQPVNIYLEANPNPNSLKFVANYMLFPPGENYDFAKIEDSKEAPLARQLFEKFDFITRVFYMSNFITITKAEETEWIEIQDKIKSFIKDYLIQGKPLLELTADDTEVNEIESGSETERKIKMVLEEYVKPAVEMDGGAISFDTFDEGIVKLNLKGACSGCPSSMVTLKSGIENLLKRMVPEVVGVEATEL